MYCGHCGAELKSGDKMCPKCGYLVLDPQQSSESQESSPLVTASEIETSQNTAIPTNSEEQKRKLPSATEFKLMLVIAMACFFFPFVTVSCMGDRVTASGVEVMTAVSLQDEYDFSELKVNTYLLAAAALAVIGFVTAKKSGPLTIPGVAAAGATVSLLLFRFKIYSFYGIEAIKRGITIDFRWGWWLSLLCFISAVEIALSSRNEPINDKDSIKPDAKETNQISILGILGAILVVAVLLFLLFGKKSEPEDLMPLEDWVAMNESNSSVNRNEEDGDIIANDIIPIGELCRAYSSNSVAADSQYANQRLNVQGEVASITPSPFDNTVSVSMSYANTESLEDFAIFMAYFEFDSSNEGLYSLEVGKTATLSGFLESGGSGTFIHFSNATLYGQEIDTIPDDEFEENSVSLVDYIGEWGDSVSQRCYMTIVSLDDNSCSIQINWSSSASSDTQWNMTGYLDKQTGFLEYQDCVCYETIYTDDDWVEAENYWNGTGSFFFSDGYLNWQDDIEQVGDRCLFEWLGYPE